MEEAGEAGHRQGGWRSDSGDIAETLNSGGSNGGFRTEPGAHLVAVGFSENQRGEVVTHDTAHRGGKPGQGYPAVYGVSGMTDDDPLLPLGLDSHRYRCCGNGVVANVAEWIGRRLIGALA